MRSRFFIIIMIFIITIIFSGGNVEVSAHAPTDETIFENADDHCNNPTMEILIAAVGPTTFDRDVIDLPKDTCVTIFILQCG